MLLCDISQIRFGLYTATKFRDLSLPHPKSGMSDTTAHTHTHLHYHFPPEKIINPMHSSRRVSKENKHSLRTRRLFFYITSNS